MPYEIKQQGNQYCVFKVGDDDPIDGGCHDTPAEAGKHKAALDAAMKRRGEMLAEIEKALAGRGLYGPFEDEAFADMEQLREQRAARAKQHGIGVKGKSNLTPPKGYPTDPGQYGDPVNLRYPADAAHAQPAVSYFNQEGQREDGGYSAEEWAIIGKRLARLCSANLRADYEYKAGKLSRKEEEASERAPFVHEVPFSLVDAEQRIVYGVVMEPDVPDAQRHAMTAEEIEATAHRFLRQSQALDTHHVRLVQSDEAQVVESWVQREPVVWRATDPATNEARETEVRPGSWCLAVQIDSDELWAEVEQGEITGFSPKGRGVLTSVEE